MYCSKGNTTGNITRGITDNTTGNIKRSTTDSTTDSTTGNVTGTTNNAANNTPYDDVYRTLKTDCPKLTIPLINEMFAEQYEDTEEITQLKNEHLVTEPDGTQKKVATDTLITIIGYAQKKYHMECQSTPDGSMLFRMFEYDSRIALENGILDGKGTLTVRYPNAGILFLRHGKSMPDQMRTVILTPGGEVSYPVKILKLRQYSIEDIFEKNLLILIPFHIFTKENLLKKYDTGELHTKDLQQEYAYICNRLNTLCTTEKLSVRDKNTIFDMSRKVLNSIAIKYHNVRKGVEEILGGKVLEYETKTIYNAGEAKGRIAGIQILIEYSKELGVNKVD